MRFGDSTRAERGQTPTDSLAQQASWKEARCLLRRLDNGRNGILLASQRRLVGQTAALALLLFASVVVVSDEGGRRGWRWFPF